VALPTNLRSGLKFEEPRITFGQAWKFAAPERRGDGHQMGIAKSLVGNELFHPSYGRDSEYAAQGARARPKIADERGQPGMLTPVRYLPNGRSSR
jgi:hypothetical protein